MTGDFFPPGIASVNKSAAGLSADTNTPHWLKSQLDATNKAIMELTSSSAQQAKVGIVWLKPPQEIPDVSRKLN